MDDVYALNVAKTEYREGFNTGNVERVLSVFSDHFLDMSDGQPSHGKSDAKQALRLRLKKFFSDYEVTLLPVIIDFEVQGNKAVDYGWHKIKVVNRHSGESQQIKERYFERWEREESAWKIKFIITNRELPPALVPESDG